MLLRGRIDVSQLEQSRLEKLAAADAERLRLANIRGPSGVRPGVTLVKLMVGECGTEHRGPASVGDPFGGRRASLAAGMSDIEYQIQRRKEAQQREVSSSAARAMVLPPAPL